MVVPVVGVVVPVVGVVGVELVLVLALVVVGLPAPCPLPGFDEDEPVEGAVAPVEDDVLVPDGFGPPPLLGFEPPLALPPPP